MFQPNDCSLLLLLLINVVDSSINRGILHVMIQIWELLSGPWFDQLGLLGQKIENGVYIYNIFTLP